MSKSTKKIVMDEYELTIDFPAMIIPQQIPDVTMIKRMRVYCENEIFVLNRFYMHDSYESYNYTLMCSNGDPQAAEAELYHTDKFTAIHATSQDFAIDIVWKYHPLFNVIPIRWDAVNKKRKEWNHLRKIILVW